MTESEIFVFGDSLSDTGNSFNFTGGLIPPAHSTLMALL
jgi:phospholipase/lecithinase/hemolysin